MAQIRLVLAYYIYIYIYRSSQLLVGTPCTSIPHRTHSALLLLPLTSHGTH